LCNLGALGDRLTGSRVGLMTIMPIKWYLRNKRKALTNLFGWYRKDSDLQTGKTMNVMLSPFVILSYLYGI